MIYHLFNRLDILNKLPRCFNNANVVEYNLRAAIRNNRFDVGQLWLFTSSRRYKTANVCLQQFFPSTLTQTVPPLCGSESSRPTDSFAVSKPTGDTLQSTVKWESQRPEPHQLRVLFPRGVFSYPDRTHQGNGEPGCQRSVRDICGEGARMFNSGPKGKVTIYTTVPLLLCN